MGRAHSLIAAAVAAAGLCAGLEPCVANAGQTAKISAAFAPERLGAPTTISLGFQLQAVGSLLPSPLRGIDFSYPTDLGLARSDLGTATCQPEPLESFGAKVCPANSHMGAGSALAKFRVGSEVYSERASLEVVAGPSQVIVAPFMESVARTQLGPRRTRPWFGHVASRQIGTGSEFWGIREYIPGDDVRRINWKSSARLDRLFSNEYEGERSGDVVILLDARRESAIGTTAENTVEYGVRAALGVAEYVLASKNRVGLIVQREVLDWVPPAFGRKQLYRILDHLIHVRVGGEWPFPYVTWVLTRYFPRDALVVLISPLTDRASLDAVTDLVAHGYDVAILSPSPLEVEKRFLRPSTAESVAYRVLVMERQNLVAQLRRIAQVVDWDPQTPLALPLRRLRMWPRPA